MKRLKSLRTKAITLSSMLFACLILFLAASVWSNQVTGNALDTIEKRHFPVLENTDKIIMMSQRLRENYMGVYATRDADEMEGANVHAAQMLFLLNQILNTNPQLAKDAADLRGRFLNFTSQSSALAEKLVRKEIEVSSSSEQVQKIVTDMQSFDDKLQSFREKAYTEFTEAVDQAKSRSKQNLYFGICMILLGGVAVQGAWNFQKRDVVLPLNYLTEISERIAKNDPKVEVKTLEVNAEIHRLTQSFQRMLASIKAKNEELNFVVNESKKMSSRHGFAELQDNIKTAFARFVKADSEVEVKFSDACFFEQGPTRGFYPVDENGSPIFSAVTPFSDTKIPGKTCVTVYSPRSKESMACIWVEFEDGQQFRKGASAIEAMSITVANTISAILKERTMHQLNELHANYQATQKMLYDSEMAAANAVQEALLPQSRNLPGVEVAWKYRSAAQTGGDWIGYYYDAISHRVLAFVGDVTGHGVPSALVTGVVSGALSAAVEIHQDFGNSADMTPEEHLRSMVRIVNHLILKTGGRSGRLMTMCFLSLDLSSGELCYLNAGHNPPFHIPREDGRVKTLMNPGNRLGFTRQMEPRFRKTTLKPGDSLFVFTDGLIENTGPQGDILSDKILKEYLDNRRGDAQSTADAVWNRANAIWKGHPGEDDVSFLVMRWVGPVDRGVWVEDEEAGSFKRAM